MIRRRRTAYPRSDCAAMAEMMAFNAGHPDPGMRGMFKHLVLVTEGNIGHTSKPEVQLFPRCAEIHKPGQSGEVRIPSVISRREQRMKRSSQLMVSNLG